MCTTSRQMWHCFYSFRSMSLCCSFTFWSLSSPFPTPWQQGQIDNFCWNYWGYFCLNSGSPTAQLRKEMISKSPEPRRGRSWLRMNVSRALAWIDFSAQRVDQARTGNIGILAHLQKGLSLSNFGPIGSCTDTSCFWKVVNHHSHLTLL